MLRNDVSQPTLGHTEGCRTRMIETMSKGSEDQHKRILAATNRADEFFAKQAEEATERWKKRLEAREDVYNQERENIKEQSKREKSALEKELQKAKEGERDIQSVGRARTNSCGQNDGDQQSHPHSHQSDSPNG